MSIVVGIDASRNRSGGAITHLVGLLGGTDPRAHGIDAVHVWSYGARLDALPEADWLVKHNPSALERSLPHQVLWQWRRLPDEARAAGCDILLNTDAGSVCRFRPAVVMSRDMLSYEPGEMQRFGFSRAWVRLLLLRWLQASSIRRAEGVIFLTEYAARVIGRVTGPLARTAIIPHGVGEAFREAAARRQPGANGPLRCLYISNVELYKHQWMVVRALGELRQRGRDLSLQLVGGGAGAAQRRLEAELARTDPRGEFVTWSGPVSHGGLPSVLAAADLFIFASSCENMPNTLVEAMASGLPIACSDRGPMPEVLRDAGLYFDPEDAGSIATAVDRLAVDPALRERLARAAAGLARQYSWTRCAQQTWTFLGATCNAVGATGTRPATGMRSPRRGVDSRAGSAELALLRTMAEPPEGPVS
jgi:glycosyltransferase involved in cell wall biosynthesis